MTVLDEFMRKTCLGKIPLIPGLDKEAAIVLEVVDRHNSEIFKRGIRDMRFHESFILG
jgi:hypothetical protein